MARKTNSIINPKSTNSVMISDAISIRFNSCVRQQTRRQQYETPGGVRVNLASPEDIILNKLQWRSSPPKLPPARGESIGSFPFREGWVRSSDKQWRDILGILKVQGESLDFDDLNSWSNQLGFSEDLQQARTEAGL